MKIHGHEFRLVTNADVPMLPNLLTGESPLVYVVDQYNYGAELPLSDFVTGPFAVTDEDGYFVIHGFDGRTGLPGKARIAGEVLQYQNVQFPEWGKTSDALRLYIPAGIPIPA
jgi:hypothetical protein